jgi:hypothetical protein
MLLHHAGVRRGGRRRNAGAAAVKSCGACLSTVAYSQSGGMQDDLCGFSLTFSHDDWQGGGFWKEISVLSL